MLLLHGWSAGGSALYVAPLGPRLKEQPLSGALSVAGAEVKRGWLNNALALKASTQNDMHQFHSHLIDQNKLYNHI